VKLIDLNRLKEITQNARVLVEQEFTYEAAVKRYRKIVDSLK